MVNVVPRPVAREFRDVNVGNLTITNIGGESFWCLKCLWQEDEPREFGLLLGPNLPRDYLSPHYYEVSPDTRTLDFGNDFILDLTTDIRRISLNLPNSRTMAVGIVVIEDEYYLRFGPLNPSESAMFLRIADGRLTYGLPESQKRAFCEGWRFRLEGAATSKERFPVCEWPPPSTEEGAAVTEPDES